MIVPPMFSTSLFLFFFLLNEHLRCFRHHICTTLHKGAKKFLKLLFRPDFILSSFGQIWITSEYLIRFEFTSYWQL